MSDFFSDTSEALQVIGITLGWLVAVCLLGYLTYWLWSDEWYWMLASIVALVATLAVFVGIGIFVLFIWFGNVQ